MTSTQKRVALALGALVLAAAAVLLVLLRADERPAADVTTAESEDAVVASGAVRDDVVAVAEEAAARVYSYSWRTLSEDKAAARALLTGGVLEQYDRTMAGVATSSVLVTLVRARGEWKVSELDAL